MDEPTRRKIAEEILPPDSSEEEIDETLAVFESTEIEVLLHDTNESQIPRFTQGPKWKFLTLLGDKAALEALPELSASSGDAIPQIQDCSSLTISRNLSEEKTSRPSPAWPGESIEPPTRDRFPQARPQ